MYIQPKCVVFLKMEGCNHGENLVATVPMVGRTCPPPHGWNRVKVSENLGATVVAPVAPVDTSLKCVHICVLLENEFHLIVHCVSVTVKWCSVFISMWIIILIKALGHVCSISFGRKKYLHKVFRIWTYSTYLAPKNFLTCFISSKCFCDIHMYIFYTQIVRFFDKQNCKEPNWLEIEIHFDFYYNNKL